MPAAKNASKKKDAKEGKEGLAVKKTVKTKAAPKPKKEKKPKAPKPKAAPKKKVNIFLSFFNWKFNQIFPSPGCSRITWISIHFYHQFQFIVITLCLKAMNKRFVLVGCLSFERLAFPQKHMTGNNTYMYVSCQDC